MKLNRSLQVALLGAVFFTRALAQTEADISSLLPKAQHGNAIAQYRLGVAYSTGQGVAANPVEAYIWLSLAYENGFRGKALGNVAGGLDAAQLETARAQLAERRASLNQKPAPATPGKTDAAEADMPVVRTSPATQPAATATAPTNGPAQELAAAVADKQQLSAELSKSWAETDEVKKQLAEIQATADFLTAETSKLRGERDSLATKLDGSIKEASNLHAERDQARGLGVQAEQTLAQTNSQKAALESSLQAAQASAATDKKWLTDELTKSFQEVSVLKAQLAEQSKTIAAAAAPAAPAYPDLSGKVRELEASLAALATEANATKQEATRLADERIDREKQLVALQQQTATLETALNAAKSAAPAYPDVRQQVASLERQLAAAKTEASQTGQQITALTQAKESAEKSLAQRPAYPDLSGKVRELEASLASLSTETSAAKQEAARLADERIDREKQLIASQQQSAALETALNAAKSAAPAYPDVRQQVASLETQLAAAKNESTQTSQQIATLTQAKESAEKALAQVPAAPAYPDLSGKVHELETSLASLSTEANAAKQEAARLSDERIDREKQLIASQQQSAALTDKYAALQQETESLRRSAAIPQTPAYPDLREQVSSLTNQLAASKAETGEAAQKIATLTQAKESAEKSLAQTPAAPAYPDLSGKVQELNASIITLTADANAAKQEASRLSDERIEREKQLIAVQQQAADLANKNTALEQEAESLRHVAAAPSVAPAYPDLHEQVAALTNQLATAKTEASQAAQQIAALTQARESAEKSLAQAPAAPGYPDLSGKVHELETFLASLTTEANAAKQEASRLADERIDREKQLIALQQQVTALAAKNATANTPAQNSPAPAYPDLSGKVQELNASIITLTADAGAAGKAVEELRQAKTEAEQKLTAADQSRTALSQQFDEFKRSALTNQRDHLNEQSKIQMLESEKAALRQQSAADQTRLADLSAQLAASRRQANDVYPTTPAYPDQRARVEQLEAELTKTNEQANGMVTLLNSSQQEAKDAAAQTEQLRATIHTLENKIAAVDTTPAYPDLRNQVASLEADLKTAKSAAPAYPDLHEQVDNLTIQLEAARNLPKLMIPAAEFNKTKQELSDTQEKLDTTLRGYAVLEKERDELASRPAAAAPAATPAYPDLRDQVASLEAELKRVNAQAERDLTAARAQSAQNAAALVQQNLPAKTPPAPEPVVMRPVPRATVVPAPALAAAPAVVSAPAPAAPRRTHVVAGGDSLSKLSQRYYGTQNRWREIYDANRDVIGSNGALRAGTELRIP